MSEKSPAQTQAVLKDDPDQAGFFRYRLGMEHLSEGDQETARMIFEALRAAKPDYVPAYLQLGQLLARLGEEEQARDVYRKGIAVARAQKDHKAADEMAGFLALIE